MLLIRRALARPSRDSGARLLDVEDQRPPVTLKTALIAVAAVAALIGAALIAVPSADDGVLHLCLALPRCLGY